MTMKVAAREDVSFWISPILTVHMPSLSVVLKKQDAVEEAHTGNSQPLIGLESSSELRDPSRGFSTLFSRVE
jgi:hypothetical protein